MMEMGMVLGFSLIDSGEVISYYVLIYFDAVLMCLQQLCIENPANPKSSGFPHWAGLNLHGAHAFFPVLKTQLFRPSEQPRKVNGMKSLVSFYHNYMVICNLCNDLASCQPQALFLAHKLVIFLFSIRLHPKSNHASRLEWNTSWSIEPSFGSKVKLLLKILGDLGDPTSTHPSRRAWML